VKTVTGIRLGLLFLAAVLFQSCFNETINDNDRAMLMTLEDFEGWGLTLPDNAGDMTEFDKTVHPDGSVSIDYLFVADDDIKSDISFLSIDIYFEKSEKDARQMKSMSNGIWTIFLKTENCSLVETTGQFDYGGETRTWSLVNEEGEVLGNRMTVLNEKVFYDFFILGTEIDDPEIWDTLFRAKLDRVMNCRLGFYELEYEPAKGP
jgi:hypothetical protein